MARNGSGSYTIPNSFTPNSTISSADFNENFTDLATEITNSVAADGQTTLTGAIKGANGTVSLPAYSFASDLDSGMYRIGANNIGIGVDGAKVVDIAATGISIVGTITPSGVIVGSAGTNSAPGYTFAGDLNTGMYQIGADNIGLTAGGTKIVDVATTGVAITGTLSTTGALSPASLAGTISGTPTFSGNVVFSGSPNLGTGTYSGAATFSGNVIFSGTPVFNNPPAGLAVPSVRGYVTYSGGVPTLAWDVGVASITDTAQGILTITFDSNFADTEYQVMTGVETSTNARTISAVTKNVGSVVLHIRADDGNLADPLGISFNIYPKP